MSNAAIRVAFKTATKSGFERAKVGAVIANKKRILSCGYNEVRYYKKCPTPRKWNNSLHAEQSAILKLLNSGRHNELVGSTIYVTRVNKAGESVLAKPCQYCHELIKSVGIKKVVFTTNTGVEEYDL